jgi:hypothetical protein
VDASYSSTLKEDVVIKSNFIRLMCLALVALVGVLATATSSMAHNLSGEFSRFDACPLEEAELSACVLAESKSGAFQIGKVNVPVNLPQILQGGFIENEETGALQWQFAATGYETLVKTPQTIPGGLFSLVKEGRYPWYLRNFCKNFPNNSECKATGTAELVGRPGLNEANLIQEEGTALQVPIRLHIKNPFLGNQCFIGNEANPIVLNFTTGTTNPLPPNMPIKGKLGHIVFVGEGLILVVESNTVVDNEFGAGGAEGCGGPQAIVVDKEINEKDALPSPPGHNAVSLNGNLNQAGANPVREHLIP